MSIYAVLAVLDHAPLGFPKWTRFQDAKKMPGRVNFRTVLYGGDGLAPRG